MKLHILSDLHLEFCAFDPPETDADVVVLAGDIDVGTAGLRWAAEQFGDRPVVYVPGNHEFYGQDIRLLAELKSLAPPNVHVLDSDVFEHAGTRFLGCVLWSDFTLLGERERTAAMQQARLGINDFQNIRTGSRRFTPEDAAEWHRQNRRWLRSRLDESWEGATVVVTHHAPSARSIPRRFARDLLSPAFASDLEPLMGAARVTLWVHGHLHDSVDCEVNGTRIVCNPRGYVPCEPNARFVPALTVEI